jgi:pimeloyl-ACP methyl ester carboxylesterase
MIGLIMEFEWKDHSIQVREFGQGPSVVLVHGYPLDGAMWSGVARTLSARFRVFKLDLPGHGENPAPAGTTLDDQADYLESLLRGIQARAGLAGFSMGGYAALSLMRRSPSSVGALALVDTRARADDEAGKAARDAAIAAVRAGGTAAIAEPMIEKLLSASARRDAPLVERLRRIILRQKSETVEADLAAMRDRADSTDLLPRLRLPALVVTGEADVITPVAEGRGMAEAIPGARFLEISAAGHMTPMERPGAVAAALGDFFGSALS